MINPPFLASLLAGDLPAGVLDAGWVKLPVQLLLAAGAVAVSLFLVTSTLVLCLQVLRWIRPSARMNGRRVYLWRAVDEHGQVLDILVQQRRDADAAEHFFRRLLRRGRDAPERIVTDKLESYPVAKQRIPALDAAKHIHVRAAARLNNRAEQSHQPTRVRERRMQRFKSPAQAQRFLTAFSRTYNLFRVRRHLLTAAEYRSTLQDRFHTWRQVTPVAA